MKDVDLTPLNDNDTEYEKIVAVLVKKYHSDWDDSIHESFECYIKQMQEESKRVHSIKNEAEMIKEEVEALDTDELRANADRLSQEVDSICLHE